MAASLYWHDYETFGTDPQKDRPVQFAGLRTDLDFNVIGDPLVLYSKPSNDYLPDPEACLITGITPQQALSVGVCEADFIHTILQQIAKPKTCTVGYNNIRFDDEITRNTLYRNLYEPYAREWQHANSRWDLIDLTRLTRALRPDGIKWPVHEDGKPSLRLEDITRCNGIEHSAAHDALADVYATIALAKLIKQRQTKLYQFVFEHRQKQAVSRLLNLGSMQPVVHVSGMYPAEKGSLAVVLPLCKHPTNSNGVLVYDLDSDPEALMTLPADAIHQRLFTAKADLPADITRIPLKTIHINKCPVLAPMSVLRPQDAERLGIDLQRCQRHQKKIQISQHLLNKLEQVFSLTRFAAEKDPDLMLYSGGFFNDADKKIMQSLHELPATELEKFQPSFQDKRLAEMFFRYRARNYPEQLSQKEQQIWQTFCKDRLMGQNNCTAMTFAQFYEKIEALEPAHAEAAELFKKLRDYAASLHEYVV